MKLTKEKRLQNKRIDYSPSATIAGLLLTSKALRDMFKKITAMQTKITSEYIALDKKKRNLKHIELERK